MRKIIRYWTVLKDREVVNIVTRSIIDDKIDEDVFVVDESVTKEFMDSNDIDIVIEDGMVSATSIDDGALCDFEILSEVKVDIKHNNTISFSKYKDLNDRVCELLDESTELIEKNTKLMVEKSKLSQRITELEKSLNSTDDLEFEVIHLKGHLSEAYDRYIDKFERDKKKIEKLEAELKYIRDDRGIPDPESYWMSPSGEMLKVGWANHNSDAADILMKRYGYDDDTILEVDLNYEELQNRGWIRIMGWSKSFVIPNTPTKRQVSQIKQYCQKYGIPYPKGINFS